MGTSLRVLLVEDQENDALLIVRELRKQGYDPVYERVDTAEAMRAALERETWDIILSDHSMPSFSSGAALEIRRHIAPHLPFVLVSGTIGEEATVQAVKAGIAEFVNKDNLNRLMPVIERVQREEDNRTRREQAEAQLHETEILLKSIFEADPTGVALTTNETYTRVNRMFCEITGYTEAELIGRDAGMIYTDSEEYRRVREALDTGLTRKKTIELECRFKRSDGAVRDILLKASPLNARDLSEGIVSAVLDITERKQTALSLMRLGTAINTIDETIIITDTQGVIQYVNPAFERTSGYSREEALGEAIHVLESGRHDQDFYRHMQQAVARDDIWKGHVVNRKKDGSLYDVDATLSCARLPDGTIANYITVQRDVTRELRLEQQYRQSQKMEAIGALAGGIAHDFNNILAAILGYTQIAMDALKDRPAPRKHLQAVIKATDRAISLVKQILTFSRSTEHEKKPVMPGRIIKEALKLLRASLPSTIEIRQAIRSDAVILADPTHIHQVVMNLCTNAGYAMRRNGGVLAVSLTDVELDPDSAEQYPGLSAGRHAHIQVKDTGCGMPPAIINRIFDPFFTTKPHGEGTGLGLSVVHGIVQACGGAVSVHSEADTGSVFDIYIPSIRTEVPAESPENPPLPRGTENILFVDDEPMLIDIGRQLLASLGYRVTVSTDSRAALETFRKKPQAFDAVITDYTMPNMTGIDLAREMIALKPGLPVILCTGCTENVTQQTAAAAGIREFVLKPLKTQELSITLRRILDEQSD